MKLIDKQYIVDENNKKIAVQMPIKTFMKIEEILENHALFHLMKDNNNEDLLDFNDAQKYYDQLAKEV